MLERAKADLEPFYPMVEGKPTVAYLWARTVTCKNRSCNATIPLLKTRWLCKNDRKRVLLTMEPNEGRTGVVFGVQTEVPVVGANAAQRREHDRRVGAGTMSRTGATCPCCGGIMTMEDIRLEGKSGRLGALMTAVVVDSEKGKEYRLPRDEECDMASKAATELDRVFAEVPFGMPDEPLPGKEALGFRVPLYGLNRWGKLFTPRQLLALGVLVKHTRIAQDAMRCQPIEDGWAEAIAAYLSLSLDRAVSFNCVNVRWKLDAEAVVDAFARFALPMLWDCAEAVAIGSYAGGYLLCYERIATALDVLLAIRAAGEADVVKESAVRAMDPCSFDLVVTDPPYYDAIPYSDLMDFFYVWLRRTLHGLSPEIDRAFHEPLAPKWDHERNDGELIDDSSRFGGDRTKSKEAYENGMYQAFQACHGALRPEGRLVIVFAHKQPDAWETLVSAIIRAGFVVDGSWPIQTEMANRTRALTSAALSSSVWLVCKKRPETARPGWDNLVLEEMRGKIATRLRDFWDAGIRGPDFVWAATGPALEAYSRYPAVKKANEQAKTLTVPEFLRQVRRIVVDFVVGRVLSANGSAEAVSGLDDVTTYYLLHRHDFGMGDAPAGACILYAISCGLSDAVLAGQLDLLVRTSGKDASEESDDDGAATDDGEADEGSGSKVRLKPWHQRKRPGLGYEGTGGRTVPLIDQIHRLMHLWKAGDVAEVNGYLDGRGLRRNALFNQLLQALIELAQAGSDERSLLESLSNHLSGRAFAAGGQGRIEGL